MPHVKFVDAPYVQDRDLENLCAYVIDYEKTHGLYGGRGLEPERACEGMQYVQALWRVGTKRQAYQIIVSFGPEEQVCTDDAAVIAFQISNLFFPSYQILYGVHVTQAHLHIHFVLHPVSLVDGKKLHLGYQEQRELETAIQNVIYRCLHEENHA